MDSGAGVGGPAVAGAECPDDAVVVGVDPTPEPTDGTPADHAEARVIPARAAVGAGLALSRIVVGLVVAHLALALFPRDLLHTPLGTLDSGRWLGAFDRWDAGHYLAVAAHGYPAGDPSVRAYFPVYPLVVRAARALTLDVLSLEQAACLVSMAAFTASAALLVRLVGTHLGRRTALASTTLFCWFPTTLFFLAPYPEALLVLESLVVAVLLDRGRWWWAAAVAGLASATTPEGTVLALALVVSALVARRGAVRILGLAVVGVSGLAAYSTFLWVRFGNPLGYETAEHSWYRATVVPFTGVVRNLTSLPAQVHAVRTTTGVLHTAALDVSWMWLLDDLAVLLGVAAVAALVVTRTRGRRSDGPPVTGVPIAWIVLLAGIVLVAATTVVRAPGAPISTEADARLVGVAFPLYPGLLLLARRRPAVVGAGLVLSAAAALVTQVLFVFGYWVT